MKEKRIVKNKLVARLGDEYYFCDDLFVHSDSFKGATGTVLTPVTQEQLDERWDAEYLRDLWEQAVELHKTDMGLDEWVEYARDTDGDESILDASGSNL